MGWANEYNIRGEDVKKVRGMDGKLSFTVISTDTRNNGSKVGKE